MHLKDDARYAIAAVNSPLPNGAVSAAVSTLSGCEPVRHLNWIKMECDRPRVATAGQTSFNDSLAIESNELQGLIAAPCQLNRIESLRWTIVINQSINQSINQVNGEKVNENQVQVELKLRLVCITIYSDKQFFSLISICMTT